MIKKIYIRAASAISPQETFQGDFSSGGAMAYPGNRLRNIEPDYTQLLDPKSLRRMSRIVKMGSATALACLKEAATDNPGAIVTGTAYGCVEDTTIFLSDAINRQEEALTPTAFIQSTHNTVGAQVALQIKCHNYNNTFVHRGFSFENALLDALLLLHEEEANTVLVGSIEELTDSLFTILNRFDLYKQGLASTLDLYKENTKGTVAGEGSAFFLLANENGPGTYARVEGAATFYKPKSNVETEEEIFGFLVSNLLKPEKIDLVITGRNGNAAENEVYDYVQQNIFPDNAMVNYKHLCGEYPTSSSFALWLAANILKSGSVPQALNYTGPAEKKIKRVLIYNHYQNTHHSLLLLSAVE